jgi:hypothetical protein
MNTVCSHCVKDNGIEGIDGKRPKLCDKDNCKVPFDYTFCECQCHY